AQPVPDGAAPGLRVERDGRIRFRGLPAGRRLRGRRRPVLVERGNLRSELLPAGQRPGQRQHPPVAQPRHQGERRVPLEQPAPPAEHPAPPDRVRSERQHGFTWNPFFQNNAGTQALERPFGLVEAHWTPLSWLTLRGLAGTDKVDLRDRWVSSFSTDTTRRLVVAGHRETLHR